jgi:DNA adenine methylase
MTSEVTRLAPYLGAKAQEASQLIPLIGKHVSFLDPACGSMAIFFAKPTCSLEIASDLHGDITNFARVLQRKSEYNLLRDKLKRTLVVDTINDKSREIYNANKKLPMPKKPDWERAYHAFIAWWMGRSGIAGSKSDGGGMAVRFTSNGGATGRRFVTAVDTLDLFVERIRPVQILNKNMFELIPKWEDKRGAVLFVDAPYYDKGDQYLFDFSHEDHVWLHHLLSEFKKTRVVVCYYNHPVIRELYKKWKMVPIGIRRNISQQNKRGQLGAEQAPELVFLNQE